MTTTFTLCPICQGQLKSREVREIYHDITYLDISDGGTLDDWDGDWDNDGNTIEQAFYCENDHGVLEMVSYAGIA